MLLLACLLTPTDSSGSSAPPRTPLGPPPGFPQQPSKAPMQEPHAPNSAHPAAAVAHAGIPGSSQAEQSAASSPIHGSAGLSSLGNSEATGAHFVMVTRGVSDSQQKPRRAPLDWSRIFPGSQQQEAQQHGQLDHPAAGQGSSRPPRLHVDNESASAADDEACASMLEQHEQYALGVLERATSSAYDSPRDGLQYKLLNSPGGHGCTLVPWCAYAFTHTQP